MRGRRYQTVLDKNTRVKVYGRCAAVEGTDELALLKVGHSGGRVFAEKGEEDGRLREEDNSRPYLLAVEGQVGLLASPP